MEKSSNLLGFFEFSNIEEAENLQRSLSEKIILSDRFSVLRFIGGVDTSFSKDGRVLSVIVVMELESLKLTTISYHIDEVKIPYIPGFLSFREGPSIIEAWEKLKVKPDILLVDGQGYAHPRHLGIASHIGIVLDIPTIGCAKSILIGKYEEPGPLKGDFKPILYKGEMIGVALRTKDNIKPVFVSPGHRVSFESSVNIVLRSITNYRLPEPLRYAHRYSKSILKGSE
ncbi:MAG: deoxyribonuclease V [bacterium]|nr:deoxyribonuclease V [bacterium]